MAVKIALIGTGGIGFRHFQSLMEMKLDTEVYAIDISSDALKKDCEYAESIEHPAVAVKYGSDVSILPGNIDVAIIATSSLVRKKLFDDLIAASSVRYVIFEKFLFPRLSDYDEVLKKLHMKRIQGYVNCPTRLYPGYRKLKRKIDSSKDLNVFIHGTNWGLACNAIHIVDVTGYLADSYDDLVCDGTLLDDDIHESRRSNYIEFTGDFLCRLGNKANIFMSSTKADGVPYESVICNGSDMYIVSEVKQKMYCFTKKGVEISDFPIIYQSKLTSSVVTELMECGDCGLTKYENTVQWHIALLKTFKSKYEAKVGATDVCPIT